nr:MAG TPA: hypothetical protein [Caudoviricetes sp.]
MICYYLHLCYFYIKSLFLYFLITIYRHDNRKRT